MKAVQIHGAADVRVDTVDDPKIEDARDAIIRVTSTAICGSDLHLYTGAIPQPRPMVLGHEFMGIVEEVGRGVGNLKVGDRVVVILFPLWTLKTIFAVSKNIQAFQIPADNYSQVLVRVLLRVFRNIKSEILISATRFLRLGGETRTFQIEKSAMSASK